MKMWKRNAVVVAIVLFVGAAVYLNWSYSQEVDAGKTLGEAALVGAQTSDPLLTGGETASPSPAVSNSNYFSSQHLYCMLCCFHFFITCAGFIRDKLSTNFYKWNTIFR